MMKARAGGLVVALVCVLGTQVGGAGAASVTKAPGNAVGEISGAESGFFFCVESLTGQPGCYVGYVVPDGENAGKLYVVGNGQVKGSGDGIASDAYMDASHFQIKGDTATVDFTLDYLGDVRATLKGAGEPVAAYGSHFCQTVGMQYALVSTGPAIRPLTVEKAELSQGGGSEWYPTSGHPQESAGSCGSFFDGAATSGFYRLKVSPVPV